jgi:hypothetical protein
MERLFSLWSYAPFIAAIVVVVAIVFVVALVVRSHRSNAAGAAPPPQPASSEIDPDLIDSSHIGFAPLVGSVSLPSGERGQNGA